MSGSAFEDGRMGANIGVCVRRCPSIHRPVVLLVEDDAGLREVYRHDLSNAGYRVVAVGDGVDALRQIDNGLMPNVVVHRRELHVLHRIASFST